MATTRFFYTYHQLIITTLIIIVVISWSPLLRGVNAVSVNESAKWELIINRNNLSSYIRLHPYIILFVTLPWFGESRSLMKELADKVTINGEEYGTPKLLLLYRNRDKMLADAIGATDGIRVIFYRHSLPYTYHGRLRTQNILSSFHYLISHPSDQLELPIQSIDTREDLNTFLQSTDKALLLLEFCGWTEKLLADCKKNGTINDFGSQFREDIYGESTESPSPHWKKYQASENEKKTCSAQYGSSGFPCLRELSSVSESDKNKSFIDGVSCSSERFQLFDTFFTKFMEIAREFLLPPETIRFGLVGDRSLLPYLQNKDASSWFSSLNIVDSDSWLTTLHFSGCPTCSIVINEGDDLKRALRIRNPLVRELEDGDKDVDPTLPANKPSIILFVDRSNDSLDIRRKSKEAIDAFKILAFEYHKYNDVDIKTESLLETKSQSKSFSSFEEKKLSKPSQKVVLKDKVSVTVINEGKHITIGSQGNSLQEILAHILQGGNGVKLSSLAKEAGFQLLSDDFDVKVQKTLPTQTEVLESAKTEKVLAESNIELQNEIQNVGDGSLIQNEEQHKTSYDDQSSKYTTFDTSTKDEVDIDENLQSEIFTGDFFFSDGGYQFLRALTGGVKIPSVVIVDPIQQKHYVLNTETNFSFSSLNDFVNDFVNGSLIPFQKSESGIKTPTEAPSPPFVNLDFRVKDFIPQLTADRFSELVLGINRTDNIAWKRDVMVLFSNSWCGFCQRMELIVREVYRVFKHYATVRKDDSFEDIKSRFPQFYHIDCTLNECSLILRSVAQREVYPYLVLFPGESKNAVFYEGDIAVSDIIKFLMHNGNNTRDFLKEKGILWAGIEKENTKVGLQEDALEMSKPEESSFQRDNKHHEMLSEYRVPEKLARYDKIETQFPVLGSTPQVVVGSLLVATDQLLGVYPFDHSLILIVKADIGTGFQGLIFNKYISWDSLDKLEDGLEMLKDARLSFGGPLLQPEMPLVALTRITTSSYSRQILQNIHFLDQHATSHVFEGIKLGNYSVSDFWFFLGFSSWGWDQLINEINRGDWNVTIGEYEHLDSPWQ